jgi:hypothetical protein
LTIDETLDRLEEDIRRLKIEFDIYFNGASKRPPWDTKGRVESVVKRLSDDRNLTFSQRYRYNSLVARFTSFREMWRRTIEQMEEGQDPRAKLAGTFAERPSSVSSPSSSTSSTPSRPRGFSPVSINCADPQTEVEKVITLYNSVLDAKRHCGEPTEKLSFEQFHKMLIVQSTKLKAQLQCPKINFSIEVEEGQVKFKAKGSK